MNAEKIKEAIDNIHRNPPLELIVETDNVHSSIEGVLPNICINQHKFIDKPSIAQKIDIGIDPDRVQLIPLNDEENNFYYAAVKHKREW